MSKKLSELKRKDIRCLIVEDFETGDIKKFIKQDDIEVALTKYTENEITKIFNPTSTQIKEISGFMNRSLSENKINSELNGMDMLISVIPMLTDIEVDLDKEKDIDEINEILSEPNEVFNQVILELNKIIMNINLDWINGLKLINKLPNEVIDALADMKNGEINGETL